MSSSPSTPVMKSTKASAYPPDIITDTAKLNLSEHAAALRLRLWFKRRVALLAAATRSVSSAADLSELSALSTSFLSGTITYIDAQQAVQESQPQKIAESVLRCLPFRRVLKSPGNTSRSPGGKGTNQNDVARGARSLLSAVLIAAYPNDILAEGGGGLTPEARSLKGAAALLTSSIQHVSQYVQNLIQDGHSTNKKCLRQLGSLLNTVVFFQRYFTFALAKWRYADARRLAKELARDAVAARAAGNAATLMGDMNLGGVAKRQEEHCMAALRRLLGEEKARDALAEAEEEANTIASNTNAGAMTTSSSPSTSISTPSRVTSSPAPRERSVEERSAEERSEESSAESTRGGALLNEQLAHELLMDPSLQLPATQDNESAPSAIQAAMKKVFWERMICGLTPIDIDPEKPELIKVGDIVQCRFGSEHAGHATAGTSGFYTAVIENIHWDEDSGGHPQLDVRYQADGWRERGIPFSRLRHKGDAPDFEPLLRLLIEVRDGLSNLTPGRPDLIAQIHAGLDEGLHRQMLMAGAFDKSAIAETVSFIIGRLQALQAPARAPGSVEWLRNFLEELSQAQNPVALLPQAFEFVLDSIEQVRRDSANAHMSALGTYLKQHGVDYERKKFAQRLAAGEIGLENTKKWLEKTVRGLPREAIAPISQGGTQAIFAVIIAALSALVTDQSASPDKLTSLPETLSMDGARLLTARHTLDMCVRAAALVVLAGAAARGAGKQSPNGLNNVLEELIIRKNGTSFEELMEVAVATTSTACECDPSAVRSLLASAARDNDELLRLLRARVLAALVNSIAAPDGNSTAGIATAHGVSTIGRALEASAAPLRRLARHTVNVHGDIYNTIITEVANACISGSA